MFDMQIGRNGLKSVTNTIKENYRDGVMAAMTALAVMYHVTLYFHSYHLSVNYVM